MKTKFDFSILTKGSKSSIFRLALNIEQEAISYNSNPTILRKTLDEKLLWNPPIAFVRAQIISRIN